MPRQKKSVRRWNDLNQRIVTCEKCPRLIRHCQQVAATKRKSFSEQEYWGKPVPNLGDADAKLLIVGLARRLTAQIGPGMFTGDRSGDFLFDALFTTGHCNQKHSTDSFDGLQLTNCAITAACHCAPPQNKPDKDELSNCQEWFDETVSTFQFKVFLALGSIGWDAILRLAKTKQWYLGTKPKFGHEAVFEFDNGYSMVGSYHPSQQNTFTGRLTKKMLVAAIRRADRLANETK